MVLSPLQNRSNLPESGLQSYTGRNGVPDLLGIKIRLLHLLGVTSTPRLPCNEGVARVGFACRQPPPRRVDRSVKPAFDFLTFSPFPSYRLPPSAPSAFKSSARGTAAFHLYSEWAGVLSWSFMTGMSPGQERELQDRIDRSRDLRGMNRRLDRKAATFRASKPGHHVCDTQPDITRGGPDLA
ncbi:hypothetical protein B0J18DRAFT_148570 [Chaetomium sp. MPI-SDFR-AT-0129]|nr:hypothetical protein B0J18DRAFT_148570 [Chaetomium sp. MPI-SDFR-AT-0129]